MDITRQNNGSLREVMDSTLQNLRNTDDIQSQYLSAKVASGRNKVRVVDANKRGFVIALDYSTNASGGFFNPDGGNMPTTSVPTLDRMTANYQYIGFGREITNENMANSKSSMIVGPGAKPQAVKKEIERRMEFEEWFFCRGDGSQIVGDITSPVSINALASGTLTLSGARDGAGAWFLRKGQRIRIYDVTLGTLKSWATVTAKTSNTAVTIIPDSALTSGNAVVDTDVVLPDGDTTTPTTTGIKGLPYLVKASGSYFDKSLSSVPALQGVIDSSTTTFTRTTMEQLYRKYSAIRNSGVNFMIAASPAQVSNYYVQFYAQNTAQVNIVGGQSPQIDNGAASYEYTHWGKAIQQFKMLHPKNFWFLDPTSFTRLTLKEAGQLLLDVPEYQMKIASGAYVNAQVGWSDDYLEYLSANPAKNAGFTGLTFSGLPLLKDDTFV